MATRASSNSLYRLANLGGLLFGHGVTPNPDGGTGSSAPLTEAWGLQSGVYTPQQLVEGFAPLLDTVVFRLGKDPVNTKPARSQLLDNIAANLATDTREATLRLSEPLDPSRREMNEQAKRIGDSLVKWARKSSSPSIKPDMYLRSPCEGHLLTPSNVDLMFGRRSAPHLMQLFNEYMHQMVLLRDSLLPFKNYQDVLIPVDSKAARGIRHLEPARAQFLAELLTKHTTQAAVVKYAKALLASDTLRTATTGYGFQYSHGTILPAFLSGGPTPLHLLQYFPTRLVPDIDEAVFDYRYQDYYSAPRVEIPSGTKTAGSDLVNHPAEKAAQESQVQSASIGVLPGPVPQEAHQLEIRLEVEGSKSVAVDLGQIARGHRYSYLASADNQANGQTIPYESVIVHDARNILEAADTGLLTAEAGGIHVIPVVDPIIALAVLGKLYPENVILLPRDGGLGQTEKSGKGFEPKFVIWGGMKQGGLKGLF